MKIILVFALCFSATAFCQETKVETVHPALDKFSNVRDFCLSDAGDEMYFTVQSPVSEISHIVSMRKTKDAWSEPVLASCSTIYNDLEPFLSPDQKRLYFASNRPLNENGDAKDHDIWYVERKDLKSAWSAPVNLGSPVNSDKDEFYPSLSADGNLYFTSDIASGMGKDDIYFCRWTGSAYEQPQLLDSSINSDGYEFNAFISRDGDTLLYTKYNAKDGLGSGDLYIAKMSNGQWQPARHIEAPINTKHMEYCPFYHENSGMLYFTSRRNELKPSDFKSLEAFQNVITGSENGASKIYKVPFKL